MASSVARVVLLSRRETRIAAFDAILSSRWHVESAEMKAAALLVAVVLSACSTRPPAAAPRADGAVRTFGSGGPTLRYLILGDSTAVAVGGSYENGIAVQTATHLARSRRVELTNVAVSGATIRDVRVEQLPRVSLDKFDVVLLIAGANDVTHLSRSRSVERDTRAILDAIRTANCRVRIVVTGSPDMSTPPRIPRLLRPLAGLRARRLNVMFEREVKERGLTFAPIAERTGPLFERDRTLFSDDMFHPNDRGYATWTTVINEALDRAMQSQTKC